MALQLANFYYDEVHTSILPQSYAKYVKSNDQWVVTDVDVRLEAANVFQYERPLLNSSSDGTGGKEEPDNKKSRRWTRSVIRFENASVRLVVNAKRTSSYYVFNLVAPLLVIVAISVFTAMLPSESEQKPEIQLTVMLAFVFYQSVLSERVPKSEAMPLLGLYVMYAILLSAAHLMFCHLVIRINHLHISRPPSQLIGRLVLLCRRATHCSERLVRRLPRSTKLRSVFCTFGRRGQGKDSNGISNSPEGICMTSTSSSSTTQETPDARVDEEQEVCVTDAARAAAPSWEVVAQCVHYVTCTLFILLNGTLVLIFIVPLFRAWARNSALRVYYDEA